MARHGALIERRLAGDAETRPLELSKIHVLLARDPGVEASYDTLWRCAHDEPRSARYFEPWRRPQRDVVELEKLGLIRRTPRQARIIEVCISDEETPRLLPQPFHSSVSRY